jgi:NAD(P)-dependent dehydrogenase (short-subunit alcohol dehydrogenase family)
VRQLEGQVAIITGASKGIGRSTALLFAQEGARVVGVARGESRLRELQREIEGAAGELRAVTGDVRLEETADRAVHEATEAFGRLDILVNNAGIAIFRPIWELSVADYDDQMDSNMRSTFLFTKAAVPIFLRQGYGAVINISSMAGVHGYHDLTAYCATKFAQVGFTQALDHELRPRNIKVTCILPGGTATEIAMGTGRTPEGVAQAKFSEPEEIARAILLAATQTTRTRVLEIRLRPMSEEL